mmetsp:Transcript_45840/g.102849  ORF Transcript_45840/g.102849 Transcript_45840/m.102849 type:complete len:203 (-) Transcript_45840:1919-2527(-)
MRCAAGSNRGGLWQMQHWSIRSWRCVPSVWGCERLAFGLLLFIGTFGDFHRNAAHQQGYGKDSFSISHYRRHDWRPLHQSSSHGRVSPDANSLGGTSEVHAPRDANLHLRSEGAQSELRHGVKPCPVIRLPPGSTPHNHSNRCDHDLVEESLYQEHCDTSETGVSERTGSHVHALLHIHIALCAQPSPVLQASRLEWRICAE